MKKLLGKATIAFAVLTFTLFSSVVAFAATAPAYRDYLTIDGHVMKYDFNGTSKLLNTMNKNDVTQDYYSLDNKTWYPVVGPLDITDMIVASNATQKQLYYKEDIDQVDPYVINIPKRAVTPGKDQLYVDYSKNKLTEIGNQTIKVKLNRGIVTLNKGDSVLLDGAPSSFTYWVGADTKEPAPGATTETRTADSANGTYSITTQAAAPNVKYTVGKTANTLTVPNLATTEYRTLVDNGVKTPTTEFAPLTAELQSIILTNLNTGNYRYEFRTAPTADGKKPYSKSVIIETLSKDNSAASQTTDIQLQITQDGDHYYVSGVKPSMEYSYDTAKAGKVTLGSKTWTKFTSTTTNGDQEKFLVDSLMADKKATGGTAQLNFYVRKYAGTATTLLNTPATVALPTLEIAPTAVTYTVLAGTAGTYVPSVTGVTGATFQCKDMTAGDDDWTDVDAGAIPLTKENLSHVLAIRTKATNSKSAASLPVTRVALDDTSIKTFAANTTDKLAATAFTIDYAMENLVGFTGGVEYAVSATGSAPKSNEYSRYTVGDAKTVNLTNLWSKTTPPVSAFGKKVYIRYAAKVSDTGAVTKPTAPIAISIPARPVGPTSTNIVANFNTGNVAFTSIKAGASLQFANYEAAAIDPADTDVSWSTVPSSIVNKATVFTLTTDKFTDAYAVFRYAGDQTKRTFASTTYAVQATRDQLSFNVKIDYDTLWIKGLSPRMEYGFVSKGQSPLLAPALYKSVKTEGVVATSSEGYTSAEVGLMEIPLTAENYGQTLYVRYAKTAAGPASYPMSYQIANPLTAADLSAFQTQLSAVKQAAIGNNTDTLLTSLKNMTLLSGFINYEARDQYFAARVAITAASGKMAVNDLTVSDAQKVLGNLQNIVNNCNAKAPQPIPVTKITLEQSAITMNAGETKTIQYTIDPIGASNKTVQWSSNNSAVTVDAVTGLITAVTPNSTAVITVTTINNVSDTCTVTVAGPTTTWPQYVKTARSYNPLGVVYYAAVTLQDPYVGKGYTVTVKGTKAQEDVKNPGTYIAVVGGSKLPDDATLSTLITVTPPAPPVITEVTGLVGTRSAIADLGNFGICAYIYPVTEVTNADDYNVSVTYNGVTTKLNYTANKGYFSGTVGEGGTATSTSTATITFMKGNTREIVQNFPVKAAIN